MDAGALDERVTFKRKTLMRDGMGGADEAWAAITDGTVWARLRPVRGNERTEADRTEAKADYLVTIRYRDDLLPTDRIEWRGRELNIRLIRDGGPRAQFLEIEAELGEQS
jgi:SPP1 family predicted phage head-tail adaptor